MASFTAVQPNLPASPRVSLLSSAQTPPAGDDPRWVQGFSWEPLLCSDETTRTFDNCDPPAFDIPLQGEQKSYLPFGISASDKCSALGLSRDGSGTSQEQIFAGWANRARRKLEVCQSSLIESEFWSGPIARAGGTDYASNTYLAGPGVDELGYALTPSDALACLEQFIASCSCGARGMIHAMPQLVSHWASGGSLRRDGNLILTINDTIVVPGAGYDGSGPNAADPIAPVDGAIWAYATGIVTLRLSPVEFIPGNLKEALNRSTNTIEVRAQRVAAPTIDCCVGAVSLDQDICGIGVGS